jgi:hypothetical protein
MIDVCQVSLGYEIKIPFYEWIIYMDVTDDHEGKEDLCICNQEGDDVTEEFLQFHPSVINIRPTGENLLKIMALLHKNLKDRGVI